MMAPFGFDGIALGWLFV